MVVVGRVYLYSISKSTTQVSSLSDVLLAVFLKSMEIAEVSKRTVHTSWQEKTPEHLLLGAMLTN